MCYCTVNVKEYFLIIIVSWLQDDELAKSESDSQDTLSMEDLATLLNDSYNLTKHLEGQVQFYQVHINTLGIFLLDKNMNLA